MAATHSKNTKVYFNGRDFSSFLNEASEPTGSQGVAETTTFADSSKTFIPSLIDATYTLSGLFDGSANATDAVFSASLAADNDLIVLYEGDAEGNVGYATRGISTSYEITAPVEDIVSVSLSAQSTTGVERINVLEPLGEETSAGSSAELDSGAASANGASLWLQVMDVSGTFGGGEGLTVSVEHATSSGGAFSSLGDFTLVSTANQHQRVAVTGTVNQFLKATWTLDGSDTPTFSFFVGVCRK